MVKVRGCSCWPFFRTRIDSHNSKESKTSMDKKASINNRSSNHSSTLNQSQFIGREAETSQRGALRSVTHQLRSNRPTENTHQEHSIRNTNNQSSFTYQFQSTRPNAPDQEVDEVRQRNKVRIKTAFSKKEVLSRNDFPENEEDMKEFKYCCPICLKYFNTILVSSCCKNYVCRFCIGDMAKKAKKDKSFVIKCAYCFVDDFKLEDVNKEESVKYYTDSPLKVMKQKILKTDESFGTVARRVTGGDDCQQKVENSTEGVHNFSLCIESNQHSNNKEDRTIENEKLPKLKQVLRPQYFPSANKSEVDQVSQKLNFQLPQLSLIPSQNSNQISKALEGDNEHPPNEESPRNNYCGQPKEDGNMNANLEEEKCDSKLNGSSQNITDIIPPSAIVGMNTEMKKKSQEYKLMNQEGNQGERSAQMKFTRGQNSPINMPTVENRDYPRFKANSQLPLQFKPCAIGPQKQFRMDNQSESYRGSAMLSSSSQKLPDLPGKQCDNHQKELLSNKSNLQQQSEQDRLQDGALPDRDSNQMLSQQPIRKVQGSINEINMHDAANAEGSKLPTIKKSSINFNQQEKASPQQFDQIKQSAGSSLQRLQDSGRLKYDERQK